MSGLRSRAHAAKAWLLDAAFPIWAGPGFDARAGLFHEKLNADLSAPPGARRVRVQARQVYCFALAGRLGWSGPWRERVESGLSVLEGIGRAAGGAIGHLIDEKGALRDARRDLYDQAFALYAFAQARPLDPARADARLGELLAYLETQRLASGGFAEGEVRAAPRRQNPHMHLFEAGIALGEAGVPRGFDLARDMADLFDARFFDAAHGALREFFESDWSYAEGEEGRTTEPGHHFEWIWLVDRWRRHGGGDRSGPAEALWRHAVLHGLHHGVAIDEGWAEGAAKAETARLWPQTEWLKAALVRYEAGVGTEGDVQAAHDALQLYLEGVPEGLWRDQRRADGSFVHEPAPASSFYHIALALSELIRVAEI